MAELLEVPLKDGNSFVVEVDATELPQDDGLVLASNLSGVAARAVLSLEESIDRLTPMISAVTERLRAVAPHDLTVEFGIKLGGETGVILAKGTADVNLRVSMTWQRPE